MGYGYGPGIGEDYSRIILILSRASGVPVVANAISYAAKLAKGDLIKISKEEFAKAKKAKLDDIINGLKKGAAAKEVEEEVVAPPKEVVTGSISGIDILELENAVKILWKNGIYAESGMGCTGPIVMVNESKLDKAIEILVNAGYKSKETFSC